MFYSCIYDDDDDGDDGLFYVRHSSVTCIACS